MVLQNYNNYNPSFASGICTTCNRVLLLHGKPYVGTTPHSLQIHPLAASEVVLSVLTRSKNVCDCSICKVVKSTKPGTKRTRPEGRSRVFEKLFKKMPITICNQCFQSIDSLRGHTCTKVFGSTNLRQMIEIFLNQEAGEKLAADQIRAKFEESEIVSLKTGGQSLTVSKGSMKPTAE